MGSTLDKNLDYASLHQGYKFCGSLDAAKRNQGFLITYTRF